MSKEIGLAKEIVLNVNKKVERTYWSNKQIDELFGKRSANEIIKNGTTCFMNPCLDLTLVSASMMYSQNILHSLVIEEHFATQKFPFNRLHFVLEFKPEKEIYTLNYKTCNEVHISKGDYRGRSDIPLAKMIRISGKRINPNKNIYENLGYNNLDNLLQNKFKGYSLESNLNRLKQDNSRENYKAYLAHYGKSFEINLGP